MFSIFSSIGPEIPFSLILLALMGLRFKVNPHVRLWIKSNPDKLFDLVDMQDGKSENWGRTVTSTRCLDAARQIYQKTYTTTLTTGVQQSFEAQFSIEERAAPHTLQIKREGLEGRSLNNELLHQVYAIAPGNGGSHLDITYNWGPRPLIAQLLARADLWGGIYRIKSLAETGRANERPYQLISAGVAVVTGVVSFAAFAILLDVVWATLIISALFIHEFGHLLAYRLMGQPWGRMVFLPFLGAIAMPRLPFNTQGQAVFAALMGPGFSVILALICTMPMLLWGEVEKYAIVAGLVAVYLNIFNLLPVEPLDGGVALRSVLSRLLGNWARFGLMATGAVIVLAGLYFSQIIIVIFGGIAILANLKSRTIDAGMQPLSTLQVCISFFGYVAILTAYLELAQFFGDQLLLITAA